VANAEPRKADYQQILLNYYTQQLVAHGAMLFAASVAAFTFVSRFVKKTKKASSVLVFIVFGGILLGLVMFLGIRLLYYGVVTDGAVNFANSSDIYPNLGEYAANVNSFALNNRTSFYIRNLVQNSSFTYNLTPFSGFSVSMFTGIFLAFIIFSSFGNCSFDRKNSMHLGILYALYALPPIFFFVFVIAIEPFSESLSYEYGVLSFILTVVYYALPLYLTCRRPTSYGMGVRVAGTVIAISGWLAFIVLYLAFLAGNLTFWQSLAMFIASGAIVIGIVAVAWILWAFKL
jgi:hypothetical protein